MPAHLPQAQFDFRVLADVNASLNALAFLLLAIGLLAIRRGNETLHKRLMLSATAVSALFLISYVTYHLNAEPKKFVGTDVARYLYYSILISHVVLAAVVVPLVIMTVIRGLRDQRERHRKLARITAPIWLYVSITGVVVYAMNYHL